MSFSLIGENQSDVFILGTVSLVVVSSKRTSRCASTVFISPVEICLELQVISFHARSRLGEIFVRLSWGRRLRFQLDHQRPALRADLHHEGRDRLRHQPGGQHLLLHQERPPLGRGLLGPEGETGRGKKRTVGMGRRWTLIGGEF